MTENPYVNLDARDLFDLAQRIRVLENEPLPAQDREYILALLFPDGLSDAAAMLLRSAQHLQGMDEKLAKSVEGDWRGGLAYAEARAKARSNVLQNPGKKITNEDGELIIAGFKAAGGEVKRAPAGAKTPPKPKVIDLTGKPSAPARTGFKLGDL